MSIEAAIAENTAALKALNATLIATTGLAPASGDAEDNAGGKPAAKAGAATKPAAKAGAAKAGATREQMVAVLKDVQERFGTDEGKAIVKSIGKATKMAEIDDKNVNAVYLAAKARLEADESEESEEESDGL